IVQPLAGYYADRHQTRWFIFIGLSMVVIFIPLTGLVNTFWLLLPLVALGSVGSSMFHPSVTGMLPLYAGRNPGLSMSIFNTGGTFAFAVGPVFITWYATTFGLSAMPATMGFGLLVFGYLLWTVPRPKPEGLMHLGFLGALKEALGKAWRPIAIIWLVMVLRAVVGQSFMTFMPVLFVQKGYSLVSTGVIFSLFTLAGTVSGLIAGYLSDRTGYRPIFFFTHALMTPALLLLLYLPGNWLYLGAIVAGGFVLATLPLGVVMAQALAPKGRSMVASLMMGLAFGLGGAFTPIIGKLGDMFSIQTVLLGVSFIPLLTVGLIVFFPEPGKAASSMANYAPQNRESDYGIIQDSSSD
ncbi:MAG: MFS transporter, partial [Deltaproteobacteria bacterium]|nr:MFS transporter [Deltaproteobacteria bacterium]